MNGLNAMKKAKKALEEAEAVGVAGVPVLIRGDDLPEEGKAFIILDLVVMQEVGYDTAKVSTVQVSSYADRVAGALELDAECQKALAAVGFSYIISRPAPTETGIISDWRM